MSDKTKLVTMEISLTDAPWLRRKQNFRPSLVDELKERGALSLIRKGIVPEDVQFTVGERASVDYVTTMSPDRDREIVAPHGVDLSDYRKNPVVLFCHDYRQMPIGKCMWIKMDDANRGLVAKTQYSRTKQADEVYEYRKGGFPMAKSIGFVPIEAYDKADFDKIDLKSYSMKEMDLDNVDRFYSKVLLLEYSDVPVPSNPDALEIAISKGILTERDVERYTKYFVITNLLREGGEDGEKIEDAKEAQAAEEPTAGSVGEDQEVKEEEIAIENTEVDNNEDQIALALAEEVVEISDATLLQEEAERLVEGLSDNKLPNSEMEDVVNGKETTKEDIASTSPAPEHIVTMIKLNAIAKELEDLKAFHANLIEEQAEAIMELKEGRVLSKKNRALVKTVIDNLTELQEQLKALYDATDPNPQQADSGKGYITLTNVAEKKPDPPAPVKKVYSIDMSELGKTIATAVAAAYKPPDVKVLQDFSLKRFKGKVS